MPQIVEVGLATHPHMLFYKWASSHGPAAVAAVFATYKFLQYRIFCWRRDTVNGKVNALTNDILAERCDEVDAISVPSCSDAAVCCVCSCPLWVRHDEDDHCVQLAECGCMLHSACLTELATKQHGIRLPEKVGVKEGFHLLKRFFSFVKVDLLCCPRCELSSASWWKLEDSRAVVMKAADGAAVAASLRRGESVCLGVLQQALLASTDAVGDALPDKAPASDKIVECAWPSSNLQLKGWQEAAVRGECSLWASLRDEGSSLELLCTALEAEECRTERGRAIEILTKRKPSVRVSEQGKVQTPGLPEDSEHHNERDQVLTQKAYASFLGFD